MATEGAAVSPVTVATAMVAIGTMIMTTTTIMTTTMITTRGSANCSARVVGSEADARTAIIVGWLEADAFTLPAALAYYARALVVGLIVGTSF